nr:hypothetical protein GCM10017745_38220 [Saccharothrix mutabilis subsp. capreolus]
MTPALSRGDTCELPATAVHWLTDDPQPGIVLVELVDAQGRPHQLVGKSAYFTGDLFPGSTYPRPAGIPCTIEDIDHGIATVRTLWVTSTEDMPFSFDVELAVLKPAPPGITLS